LKLKCRGQGFIQTILPWCYDHIQGIPAGAQGTLWTSHGHSMGLINNCYSQRISRKTSVYTKHILFLNYPQNTYRVFAKHIQITRKTHTRYPQNTCETRISMRNTGVQYERHRALGKRCSYHRYCFTLC
jgi:hypothetical protein